MIRGLEANGKPDELAVLIVDDSMLEKPHTDANELICTHYDHSQQRLIKVLNFVTLVGPARCHQTRG